MKVEKIIFDNEDEASMLYFYEDGSAEVKSYPPVDPKDKKLVEEFGGHYNISKETFKYNKNQSELIRRFDNFINNQKIQTDHFVIDSIVGGSLTKEELMKLKLSIFDNDFVKKSTNREILTNIRTSEDPIDLIMYFGMLRKEVDVEN